MLVLVPSLAAFEGELSSSIDFEVDFVVFASGGGAAAATGSCRIWAATLLSDIEIGVDPDAGNTSFGTIWSCTCAWVVARAAASLFSSTLRRILQRWFCLTFDDPSHDTMFIKVVWSSGGDAVVVDEVLD